MPRPGSGTGRRGPGQQRALRKLRAARLPPEPGRPADKKDQSTSSRRRLATKCVMRNFTRKILFSCDAYRYAVLGHLIERLHGVTLVIDGDTVRRNSSLLQGF